jgi:hypothetical protein
MGRKARVRDWYFSRCRASVFSILEDMLRVLKVVWDVVGVIVSL